jgi:hypothetical protein
MKNLVPALAFLVTAGGCTGFNPTRFSSLESYKSNTTPNSYPSWGGDPYAFNGIGEATGGQKPKTTHRTDSPAYDARFATGPDPKSWKKGDDQRPKFAKSKHAHGDDHSEGDHGGEAHSDAAGHGESESH